MHHPRIRTTPTAPCAAACACTLYTQAYVQHIRVGTCTFQMLEESGAAGHEVSMTDRPPVSSLAPSRRNASCKTRATSSVDAAFFRCLLLQNPSCLIQNNTMVMMTCKALAGRRRGREGRPEHGLRFAAHQPPGTRLQGLCRHSTRSLHPGETKAKGSAAPAVLEKGVGSKGSQARGWMRAVLTPPCTWDRHMADSSRAVGHQMRGACALCTPASPNSPPALSKLSPRSKLLLSSHISPPFMPPAPWWSP